VIPRFSVYLFDVDGTLLDSAADITGAVREALAHEGVNGLSQPYLESFIGFHLYDLFGQVLPHYSREKHEQVLANYRSIYLARRHQATRVYEGVPAMLSALGGRKSTATTKSSETARNILEQFGLARHFEHIQGTDGFPSKPEPDVILRSLDALGARPGDCLLIGDAAPDMEAGRRAGVKTCAVRWGYGDPDEMARHQPDYWIGQPSDLAS
jgi:phosphoglycolate phosphatase